MRYKGITVLIYALLVLIGGIIGYVKAQSAPSLMMGVLSSLFLSVSAFSLLKGQKLGFLFSTLITACLAAFFSYRFFLNLHCISAAVMSALSIIVLLILLVGKKSA